MLFHSYVFLLAFLPITWAGFLLLKRQGRGRAAAWWLLASSLFFYGWWNPKFLLLILASISGNFAFGLALGGAAPGARKPLLLAGLAFNLGILGYFKYAGFLLDVFDQFTGQSHAPLAIVLPLAISFYTFQQISYVVDTYRSGKPECNFLSYCLFIVIFPHLIAGPITHHSKIIPQFAGFYDRTFHGIDYAVGLSLIAVGLMKKVWLADPVGGYFIGAYPLIDEGVPLGFFESWGVMTACALQIYFDYSGYADMAAGLGLLFGVRMPLNFFSPYKATSPIDFWRRWNMTLMKFLRDYIYIPIGGSRYGELRKYTASMVTMVVCGLWHGSGWNYIVWGVAVGLIIMFNNLWDRFLHFAPPVTALGRYLRMLSGRLVTFCCYVLPLAIFMFPSLSDGARMVKGMLGFQGFALPIFMADTLGALPGVHYADLPVIPGWSMLGWIGICLFVTYGMPNTEQLFGRYRPTQHSLSAETLQPERVLFTWHPNTVWAWIVGAMIVVSLTQLSHVREFFYFQF
ncbi:MAG: MBOAT family O-acyltransferase [Pseudomonadota bacterium]